MNVFILGFLAGIAFTILVTVAAQAYGKYKANREGFLP